MEVDEFTTEDELSARLTEVKERLTELDVEYKAREFSEAARAEWNELNEEHDALAKAIAELAVRRERLAQIAENPENRLSGDGGVSPAGHKRTKSEWTWDTTEIRMAASTQEDYLQRLRDNAMAAVEREAYFPAVDRQSRPGKQDAVAKLTKEDAQGHIQWLLDKVDRPDERTNKEPGEIARRILETGNPVYRKAFFKYIMGHGLSPEEQRALSTTGSAGGFALVYSLDPTIVPTSNWSVNPWRAVGRIETIAGTNEWKAVTSGAMTFAYTAEGTEAADQTPTLAQPDIIAEKAQGYVAFSMEIGQDWGRLEAEMGQLFADGKDDIEALKFATGAGHGSNEPKGVLTAATNTTATTTTGAFVIADVYKLLESIPARYRPRTQFVANLAIINKVRQFDTAGGSGVWIGGSGLQAASGGLVAGTANSRVEVPLLGRDFFESTTMASVITTGSSIILGGDFRYFVILDRIGMNVEVLPMVVGTNHRPTGQRGLYATFRNSSDVLSDAAFRVLRT